VPGAGRCRIEIRTKGPGILGPEATGLNETIQAGELVVSIGGDTKLHVVVRSAKPPFLLDSDDESIRKLFPDAIVSLVHADIPGAATISSSATGERERFGAAAAVATLKRSWAWDESPAIRITFEDGGRAFRLNPVVEDGVWWIEAPK
jgi:hypothetical protein